VHKYGVYEAALLTAVCLVTDQKLRELLQNVP